MGDNGSFVFKENETLPHSDMMLQIAGLRRELDLISNLLTGHGNGDIDALEDTKGSHHFHSHCEISETIVSENVEDLKHLSHEQLINNFKTVMNQMKREHDYKIQEITEDYFSIKRRCSKLEEHGALFPSSNNNNEFDMLQKKIPDFITKLDKILLEYDKSVFEGKRDAELDSLLGSLTEADQKISQLTQVEENHRKLIQKLQTDVEDSRVEASIYKEEADLENYIMREVYELIVRDLVSSKSKIDLQDSWVESYMTEEYCAVIYKEALKETLGSEKVNKERLKGEIHWVECLVKEKENDLATERDTLKIVFEQINNLQFQIDQQAEVILGKNTQLKGYEMKISELGQELELARKKMKITENEKVNCELNLLLMVPSLAEWSKAFDNFEGKIAQKMKKTNSRLRSMQRQLSDVSDEVDELKARKFMYKQQTEKKTFDLQKAETEVDLLGNEVESLLDLLKKIYIALDHYSPILKHYPGIIEILKLVRRELRGESKRYSVF